MRLKLIKTIFFSLTFFACSDQVVDRNYPIITSTKIAAIIESGITVEVTLGGVITGDIIDHGFYWSGSKGNFSVHLGPLNSQSFSATIDDNLYPGREYSLNAFITTNDFKAFGKEIKFISKGSTGFTIDDVSPRTFNPGDILTVAGTRFGNDINRINVDLRVPLVSSTKVQVLSVNDTTITIKAPKTAYDPLNLVVNSTAVGEKTAPFQIQRRNPKLISIASADICSPIVITGDDLLYLGPPKTIYVGGSLVNDAVITSDKITLPKRWHSTSLKIDLNYADYNYSKTFIDPASKTCTN